MKSLNKLFLSVLGTMMLLVTSCTPEIEDPIYGDGGYVVFIEPNRTIGDGAAGPGNEVVLEVLRGGTSDYNSDVIIEYTVSAVDEDGNNANTIVLDDGGGEVTIAAGDVSSSVTLEILGNGDMGEQDVIVTVQITSVSGGGNLNIGFPGPDALASAFVLTIVDDDCPVQLVTYKNLVNDIDPDDEAVRIVSINDDGGGSFTISDGFGDLEDSEDDPFPIPVRFILNPDNSIIIPNQTANGGQFRFSGSGFFDTCRNVITYTITETEFGRGESTHELIPG